MLPAAPTAIPLLKPMRLQLLTPVSGVTLQVRLAEVPLRIIDEVARNDITGGTALTPTVTLRAALAMLLLQARV